MARRPCLLAAGVLYHVIVRGPKTKDLSGRERLPEVFRLRRCDGEFISLALWRCVSEKESLMKQVASRYRLCRVEKPDPRGLAIPVDKTQD